MKEFRKPVGMWGYHFPLLIIKMKTIMAGVTVLVLFASCGNSNKTDADPFASITHLVDSAMVNKTDSIDREKTSDEPKPIEADESFDDFIYNFASDDALQRQRIGVSVAYYNGERASKIDRKYWKHDDLFAKQSYYTLLFDREEDMDLVGDTSLTSVRGMDFREKTNGEEILF